MAASGGNGVGVALRARAPPARGANVGRARVGGQVAEQAARGGQCGIEVLNAGVGLLSAAGELPGLPLEEALESLARPGVERVEQLVEVARGRGLVGPDLAAVGNRRRAVGRD